MDVSLGGGHARHLELSAPLPHPNPAACPLGALGALAPLRSSLRSLRLHHVAAEALPVVGDLHGLQELEARVNFGPAADPGWLDWASELRALRRLALRAAVLRLQPEEGLGALAPLAPTLTSLTLRGCVLLGDAGCAALAALHGLRELAVTPCGFGQAGLDLLTSALSALDRAELRLQDGVAPHALLDRGRDWRQAQAGDALAGADDGEPAPPPASTLSDDATTPGASEQRRPWGMLGGLTAHVSRTKALGLLTTACAVAPGLRALEVRHSGGPFLLASPPPLGALAPGLRSLALPGIQLMPEAVEQLALCTRLERLGPVELHLGVRDVALGAVTALGGLTALDITASFYITGEALGRETDAAIARLLSALPLLRDLSLAQLQCSGDALSPLAAMHLLRRLRLASCHLTDGEALGASLAGASALESLVLQSCGVRTAVCQAVAKAAPALPQLRELELALSRPPAPEDSAALATAASACARLTSLDLHFPSHSGAVAHAPGWAGLAGTCGPSLRRLHVCTGLGWERGAFAVVAASATGLRELLLTDNAGAVEDGWMAVLGGCAQLSSLDLGSCGHLGPDALASLCRLSALTSLVAYRCPGLGPPDGVIAKLRGALPCLTLATVHG